MQTNEVKAAACVLKQPFLTFERILGLVGPGSRAFILHAIHAAEKGKKGCLHFMSVSGKDVCGWTVEANANRVSIEKGEHYSQWTPGDP